jgi:hypothetical protein
MEEDKSLSVATEEILKWQKLCNEILEDKAKYVAEIQKFLQIIKDKTTQYEKLYAVTQKLGETAKKQDQYISNVMDILNDVHGYLDKYADFIDDDEGKPVPNTAAILLEQVELFINKETLQ